MSCAKRSLPMQALLVLLSLPRSMAAAASPADLPAGGGPLLLYTYDSVITVCTGACDSIAALGVGASLTGNLHLRVPASSSFTLADIRQTDFSLQNDQAPAEPYNGSNVTSANPLPFQGIAILRESVTSDGVLFTTGGTIGAGGDLVSGTLLYQVDVPPFNSDTTWVIFDLGSGQAQFCLFFEQVSCIAGATEAVVSDGKFLALGSDIDADAIPDSVDNCTNDANPLQVDANGDGIGNVCDADIAGPAGPGNDDCMINFFDLARMKAVFYTDDPVADIVGVGNTEPDGVVAFFDFGRMKQMFFGPPGPSATGCN